MVLQQAAGKYRENRPPSMHCCCRAPRRADVQKVSYVGTTRPGFLPDGERSRIAFCPVYAFEKRRTEPVRVGASDASA